MMHSFKFFAVSSISRLVVVRELVRSSLVLMSSNLTSVSIAFFSEIIAYNGHLSEDKFQLIFLYELVVALARATSYVIKKWSEIFVGWVDQFLIDMLFVLRVISSEESFFEEWQQYVGCRLLLPI